MKPLAGIRDIAAESGYSVATVSRALNGSPTVRAETSAAIHAVAERLGYKGNAVVSGMMSAFRKSRGTAYRENLAFLWLSERPLESEDLPRASSYFLGACKRGSELGYKLEEYYASDYTGSGLARVLQARGIRGVIIAPPLTPGKTRLRFSLDGMAAVSLGWGVMHPALDVIRYDYYKVMQLALRQAGRLKGSRIGMIWRRTVNRRSDGIARAGFLVNAPASGSSGELEERIFLEEDHTPESLVEGCKAKGVDALIIGAWSKVTPELFRVVPGERIVSFAHEREARAVGALGWIDPRPELMGRWGVEQLVGKLSRFEFGVPEVPRVVLVPPVWHKLGGK